MLIVAATVKILQPLRELKGYFAEATNNHRTSCGRTAVTSNETLDIETQHNIRRRITAADLSADFQVSGS